MSHEHGHKSWIAAAATSLAVPGGGQVLYGRWRRGLAWFAACTVLFVMLPTTGPLGLVAALVARLVAGPIDAAVMRPGGALTGGRRALVIVAMAVVMIALTVVVRTQLIEGFRVPAGSMQPTLQVGDYFFVDKRATTPAVGDVIVFRHPQRGDDFVKRVIGVAGDRIAVRAGRLERNGAPVPLGPARPCTLSDPLHGTTRWHTEVATCADETLGAHRHAIVTGGDQAEFPEPDGGEPVGPYTVPAGHVFVLGDNRPNSNDSRFWGPVPVGNVRGTALYVWLSKGQFGLRWARFGRRID